MPTMRATALFLAAALARGATAQAPRALTADDYARAERFMGYNTTPLISGAAVRPTWLSGDRFWYRNAIAGGAEFVLVDPARRTRTRAFDHEAVAAALSRAADTAYTALQLPFTQFTFTPDERAIVFEARSRRWRCERDGAQCTEVPTRPETVPPNAVVSPDGKRAAFVRDHNLWLRDLATGAETPLTTDGAPDFGYATDNAGWTKSDRPVLLWSPDSRRIATFQHDGRAVGEMYLVETRLGHPRLQQWKYPLPGDSAIFTIHRVVIQVEGPQVVRLQMPPDAHRSSLCDHVVCRGEWVDVEWSPDGTRLFFLSTSRDHKTARLREADPATGVVREILAESVATFYESGFGRVNWHVLPESNEVLWFSQRDDWGHLYLYDLRTGRLLRQITSGPWNVLQVLRVDPKTRTLWFTAAGREPGDPYFRKFYRVRLDGTRLALLTPEDADHEIVLSPSGRYFVDSYSRPEVPPVTVLRDLAGRTILTLERADISRLLATGWTPPLPFTVKARDGRTDLYGLMFRPTDFDSTRKYPVIVNVYPGPQTGSVGTRSFSAARGDARALAELGFIVIQLDAMGTPMRSKSFHAAYYGNMGDNGLPDQIAGLRELARRHPWIDLDRVGIYGHSGGGYAAADAILRYPEVFKVAVSQAGNHDNRLYEDDWGEKWQGLLERLPDGTTTYDNQANQLLAGNLRGKLLIAHGTLDDNVPPYGTLLLVDELIRHNKDFDLVLFPNRRHGFGNEAYMVRRRWDYFVRWLLGAEPPQGYQMHPRP
jgi:dipeptidyl aminopeptidase/acylaminoacyl peptidase